MTCNWQLRDSGTGLFHVKPVLLKLPLHLIYSLLLTSKSIQYTWLYKPGPCRVPFSSSQQLSGGTGKETSIYGAFLWYRHMLAMLET